MIELSVHLYAIGRMSFGQARHLAQLGVIDFQKEVQKRNVYLNYDEAELEKDLKTIAELGYADSH